MSKQTHRKNRIRPWLFRHMELAECSVEGAVAMWLEGATGQAILSPGELAAARGGEALYRQQAAQQHAGGWTRADQGRLCDMRHLGVRLPPDLIFERGPDPNEALEDAPAHWLTRILWTRRVSHAKRAALSLAERETEALSKSARQDCRRACREAIESQVGSWSAPESTPEDPQGALETVVRATLEKARKASRRGHASEILTEAARDPAWEAHAALEPLSFRERQEVLFSWRNQCGRQGAVSGQLAAKEPPWAEDLVHGILTRALSAKVRQVLRRKSQALAIDQERAAMIASYQTLGLARVVPFETLEARFSIAQLLAWLDAQGTLTKHAALRALVESLTDPLREAQFIDAHRQTFGVHPCDVERRLGITTAERKRWMEAGLLPVVGFEAVSKYGRTLDVPHFDAFTLADITPEAVARWREADAKRTAIARKQGAEQAKETRALNDAARAEAEHRLEARRARWLALSDADGLLAATLEVAFWTLWASRWAKTRVRRGRRRSAIPAAERRSETWYARKRAALALMTGTPFAEIAVYVPEDHARVRIELCGEHYEEFRDMRDELDIGFPEYRDMRAREIRRCEACVWSEERHYYSLYSISIAGADERFRFHCPVPIGRSFLPPPKALAKVDESGNECWGDFRFGRGLDPEEERIYTQAKVERSLSEAMAALEGLLSMQAEDARETGAAPHNLPITGDAR